MLTAHRGHKIDGQEHVLIKQEDQANFRGALLKKAWGVKILCLSSMTVLLLCGGTAQAWAQSPVYSTNSSTSAQTEVRLQQMETQIRELTGRVEKQIYEINQLKQQVKTLKSQDGSQGSSGVSGIDHGSRTNELPRANVVNGAPLGSGQILVPEREKARGSYDLSGTSVMAKSAPKNPLNLNFKPPETLGMKTAVPGGGTTEATALYEHAYANLKIKEYQKAQEEFQTFLKEHSDHVLAANAKYWLGETYYVRGEYKKSARTFAEGFQTYPESAKSPDILLKLGMSLNGMGKKKDACVALSQVPVKFPTGAETILTRAAQEMKKLGCESSSE